MKTPMITDKHFIDWESDVFGFGYGTGEAPILEALHVLMTELIENRLSYDYHKLEERFGRLSAWLMINILCHADIFEYGTSPRYGWLSSKGKLLREFVSSKTPADLDEIIGTRTQESNVCMPHHCNCDDGPCNNPLFERSR